MTLEEFEIQYREAMDHILNQLQTVTLLNHQVQEETVAIGLSVQNLSQLVETFIQEHNNDPID